MTGQTLELNRAITVVPVVGEHDVTCPACHETVLTVFPDHDKARQRYWLEDGDLIRGVHEALEDRQKDAGAFDDELLVGRCGCGKQYYVISVAFMDCGPDEAADYLHFGKAFLGERFFICARPGARGDEALTWLLRRCTSDVGPMWHHIFGPFALEKPDSVAGLDGVWARYDDGSKNPWHHGRALLLRLWDELRAVRTPLDAASRPD